MRKYISRCLLVLGLQGKVLKLKTTPYGLCQSPRAVWKYPTSAMVATEMRVSKLDLCLLIGDCVMAVAFVDDILFWVTDQAYISKLGNTCINKVCFWNKRMMLLGFLVSK